MLKYYYSGGKMPGKIKLLVTEGPDKGQEFMYEDHNTFLFGRMPDCHICLPGDISVSRHHFILEVNPPDARIRDLGSLNGTHVNGKKIGGRLAHETPEEGAKRQYPEIDLHDKDKIRVGTTYFKVNIEIPPPPKEPLRCQQCGKDATFEVGSGWSGEYVCEDCRKKVEENPSDWIRGLLKALLVEQAKLQGAGDLPRIELPDYEFSKVLGVGGFGAVYLMQQKKTGKKVALKLMLPKKAADEKRRKAFLREVESSRDLKHKNIIEFYDCGSQAGVFYFLMEYCEGGSVSDLMNLRGGRLPQTEAKDTVFQALEGLAYLHEKNFIHRDIKPPNILLTAKQPKLTVKLADLGLAKNFAQAGFSGHTLTGEYAGSVAFMPPEQVSNYKFSKPPTDIWAMGATIYNMLTGNVPHDFPYGADQLTIVLHGDIVPIHRRDASIQEPLAKVIDRCLERDIGKRYQNAGELLNAMEKAWK